MNKDSMNGFSKILNNLNFSDNKNIHYDEIEFIKSIAIIAVIILHTVPSNIMLFFWFPFHIWHAVPVFMVIAGLNCTLSASKSNDFKFFNEYSIHKIKKYFQRILLPFTIIWIIEIFLLKFDEKVTMSKIIVSYFSGGIGPGSYFTPLFIQHLILFPIILWIKNKFYSHNHYLILVYFFLFSIFLEWLCIVISVPIWLYRILYIRYIFAAVMGSYIVSHGFKASIILLFASLSFVYIGCVSYFNFKVPFIYPSWIFQHAPAYFYTTFLVLFLWWIFPFLKRYKFILIPLGRASYHIFLIQMVWFWKLDHYIREIIGNNIIYNIVYLMVSLLICLSFGNLFFKIHFSILGAISSKFENIKLQMDGNGG
jgi:hypothetical protein